MELRWRISALTRGCMCVCVCVSMCAFKSLHTGPPGSYWAAQSAKTDARCTTFWGSLSWPWHFSDLGHSQTCWSGTIHTGSSRMGRRGFDIRKYSYPHPLPPTLPPLPMPYPRKEKKTLSSFESTAEFCRVERISNVPIQFSAVSFCSLCLSGFWMSSLEHCSVVGSLGPVGDHLQQACPSLHREVLWGLSEALLGVCPLIERQKIAHLHSGHWSLSLVGSLLVSFIYVYKFWPLVDQAIRPVACPLV